MEIYVEGCASQNFAPNKVIINFDYEVIAPTYEKCLTAGAENVNALINVLTTLGINKKEFKTTSFRVSKKQEFNYETKKNVDLGFAYNQNSVLTLKYDIKLVTKLMEEIAKLKIPPRYRITFGLTNEAKAKADVITKVYLSAKEKAEAIAQAAGKKLKNCLKVSFQPINEQVISNSHLGTKYYADTETSMYKSAKTSVASVLENTFVPEDIIITETLYYLWLAE